VTALGAVYDEAVAEAARERSPRRAG
jgi:hypothetical protein